MREQTLDLFRQWRERWLCKYDILRLNVLNEDIDPQTNQPYTAMTNEEKQWRLSVLNFTDLITDETQKSDYPTIPQRLLNL